MQRILVMLAIMAFISFPLPGQEKKTYRVEAISMKDCLMRAIKYNLELEVEGYNPRISEFDLMLARSEFDPILSSTAIFSDSQQQQSSAFQASSSVANSIELGFQKKHLLGGTIGLFYKIGYSRQTGNEEYVNNSRQYEHEASLRISQPLLRNFGIDTNMTQISLAHNEINQSLYNFQNKAISVLADVQTAYWNLVNARDNYDLQRKSLGLAQNLYKITQARIKAGSLAAADILDIERNVASKRDSLIVAEKSVYDAEDLLKQKIRPLDLDYYRDVRLIPTDRPIFKKMSIDFEETLRHALEHRPDLRSAKIGLKSSDLSVSYQKNQLLPKLDISANIGLSGLGTENHRAWKPVRDADYPSWQVQLSLEFPLGNRAAKSNYQKALIERKKAIAQYRNAESLVLVELRNAVRALETAMRRVFTAQRTRELAEKQLANEENKFRAGIITLFQVQDTEEKLTQARLTENNALLDYQRAQVTLEKSKGSLLQSLRRYNIQMFSKK